jgi:alginate O-acetyltransferase complex protein AlgI
MLFNSPEFVFAFLPLALAGFFLFGMRSRGWALGWLIAASIFFYAWWRPANVLIIAPSILVNFVLARTLLLIAKDRVALSRWVLGLGVTFNVCFLGYFKYVNFLAIASNDLFDTGFVLEHVILPLGISFITFQKIAFLVDVQGRRVQDFSFRDFCLFVLFFPQLIAGPIVHFREMMPQFHRLSGRFDAQDVSVGLTLFVIGLFKKVVLADGIALHVSPIYAGAESGGTVLLFDGWIAALGFTLQIYFDFSAYSDMALGLGRMFGVRLPMNFDSPLKATSIIDFWLRWHMTLTRFLTAYLYNPLVLWLTRRRFANGLPGVGGRDTTVASFLQLLAAPTVFTMFISGLWHGAGYTFMLWGLLHGGYLVVNHAWRTVLPKSVRTSARYRRVMRPLGWLLTFLAVVVAMVVFRAPTVTGAGEILKGLAGLNGIGLPEVIVGQLGPVVALLSSVMTVTVTGSAVELFTALAWVGGLLILVLAAPNALELLARCEPSVGYRRPVDDRFGFGRAIGWRPSLVWGVGMVALAVSAAYQMGSPSEFLYWQF